jgi:hypothetical protein
MEQNKVLSMKQIDARYASSERDWFAFLRCWNDKLSQRARDNSKEYAEVIGLLEKSRNELSEPGSRQYADREGRTFQRHR